jgi:hypothetical protein
MSKAGAIARTLAYADHHGETLSTALARLRLWPAGTAIPAPAEIATGVAGISTVYFIFLPNGSGSGRYVIAKFDDPARSRIEWNALDELRQLSAPPEILRPIEGNRRDDGVLIFDAAQGLVGQAKCVPLLPLLHQQIGMNPKNCVRAVEKTFKVLSQYYSCEPGRPEAFSTSQLNRWRDIFPNLEKVAILDGAIATAKLHFPEIDWAGAHRIRLPFPRRDLPNPFLSFQGMLGEPTGTIQLSRIHGDLNLTNVIAVLEANKQIERVFIVDLTNCQPGRALAVDFSRFELEVWRRAISNLHFDEQRLLEFCANARDFLDGRVDVLQLGLPPDVVGAIEVTNAIRHEAAQFLRTGRHQRVAYALEDFFRCLYFQTIRALAYPDVRSSPRTAKVLLLCGCLTLEYLAELDAGSYADGATQKRWLPPRTTLRAIDSRTADGQDSASLKEGSTRSESDALPTAPKRYRSIDWRRQREQLAPLLVGKTGGVAHIEVPHDQSGVAISFAYMLKQSAQSDQRGIVFQISPENNWTRYPVDILVQMAKKFQINSIDPKRVKARALNSIPNSVDVASLVGEIGSRLGSWRYFLFVLHCHRIEHSTLMWLKEMWDRHLSEFSERGMTAIFIHDPALMPNRGHLFPTADVILPLPTVYDGVAFADALNDIAAIIYDHMRVPDLAMARLKAKAFLDTCEQNPRDVHDRFGAMLAGLSSEP